MATKTKGKTKNKKECPEGTKRVKIRKRPTGPEGKHPGPTYKCVPIEKRGTGAITEEEKEKRDRETEKRKLEGEERRNVPSKK